MTWPVRGGRYIWVDRVLTEKDEFNLPLTKDIVESYLHVLTDIREAIIGLPETAISGRLTKKLQPMPSCQKCA